MSPEKLRAEQMDRSKVRQRILSAIRDTLAREVIPELRSEKNITNGHLLLRLLDYLGEDETAGPPSLAGRTGLPQQLADELKAIAGETGGAVRQNELESIGQALGVVLTRADRASRDQPEISFVRRLAAFETEALNTLDKNGARGVGGSYAKGIVKITAQTDNRPVAPPLSEELLTPVLRTSGLFGTLPVAAAIVEIPGGFNKVTTSFTVEHDGIHEALIIRRDAVPNPTGFSVVNEFPVLKAVFDAGGVPLPEPLLVGRDEALLGSPFMVVRRMPGSTDISSWRADPIAGRLLAEDLARALARLHSIDIAAFLPPGEPQRPLSRYVADEIERWYQRSKRWRVRPSPVIDAGFAWMRANIPRSARKPALVHGDVGFHNMLMDNGRLTALLDWEFCHIGDPMEDLNYCRPFLSEVCDWQHFLDAYRESGGPCFDPASADFFEVWPSVRNGSGCDALMRVFLEHPGSDIKFAVAGTQHVRLYENAVLSFLGRQGVA